MNSERIPLFVSSVEDVFNNCVSFEGNTVILDPLVGLDFINAIDKIFGFEVEVLYRGEKPFCIDCGIEMWGNGSNTHWIDKIREVKKQSYVCQNCGTSTTTNLDFVPKSCNYTIDVQEEGLKQGLVEYKSLEKVAETIHDTYGCKPTRQTILYHMDKHSEKYLGKLEDEIEEKFKEEKIEFSGVYHYDEQYEFINGELTLRLTLLDHHTRRVVNETFVKGSDLNKEFVKNFIHYNTKKFAFKRYCN